MRRRGAAFEYWTQHFPWKIAISGIKSKIRTTTYIRCRVHTIKCATLPKNLCTLWETRHVLGRLTWMMLPSHADCIEVSETWRVYWSIHHVHILIGPAVTTAQLDRVLVIFSPSVELLVLVDDSSCTSTVSVDRCSSTKHAQWRCWTTYTTPHDTRNNSSDCAHSTTHHSIRRDKPQLWLAQGSKVAKSDC